MEKSALMLGLFRELDLPVLVADQVMSAEEGEGMKVSKLCLDFYLVQLDRVLPFTDVDAIR